MILEIRNLELHVDVTGKGDLEEAKAVLQAANLALAKQEGNPALFGTDPLQFEKRAGSDDEFECVHCDRIFDIDDSIELCGELWCEGCVDMVRECLKLKVT